MIYWNSIIEQFLYDSKSPIIFNSGFFVWIFTFFISIYYFLHKQFRAKVLFCIAFSLYFYYKSSGIFFLLLVGSAIADYGLGHWVYRAKDKKEKLFVVILSLVVNLGMLSYFKYTNFFGEIWAGVTSSSWENKELFLPVGISFFTFQSLSYIIDIYRNEIKPLNNILDYAFFITFFPQLVAGPIVRAKDFIAQIYQPVLVTKEMLNRALQLIIIGLFTKAVISDYIGINFVDRIFENPNLYSGLENLVGVYGYALQIYCDFSGYSNMAIGIALMIGFHFPKNFDLPYRSKNITEFWRRWHISLSSWLRDYLYISMGGNRHGEARTYLHLMITMLLGGLWHGASWLFIIWGALHGFGLAIHKALSPYLKNFNFVGSKFLSVFITFHFVCFCWIFFRAQNLATVTDLLNRIFTEFNGAILFDFISGYKLIVVLMLVGYVMHFAKQSWIDAVQQYFSNLDLVWKVVVLLAVIVLVGQVKSSEIAPFIYFNF